MALLQGDLLHPDGKIEKRKHKLKRLVQRPNSYFLDVKCPGCYSITCIFSHATTRVVCGDCGVILCTPTGGKAMISRDCKIRIKRD